MSVHARGHARGARRRDAGGAPQDDRREEAVRWATGIGLVLAAVGLVDGLAMALKRTVAACPDGKYFPDGTTDFNCYVHPQAGAGIAIAVFSVLLGILLVFASMAVRAGLAPRQPSP